MKNFNAKTDWKDKNKLSSISNSEIKYAPLIIIDGADLGESWSCVVDIISKLSDTEAIADISFLSPHAPSNLLVCGATFSLYEGHKLVANGEIVSHKG